MAARLCRNGGIILSLQLYPPQEAHSANLLRALNKRSVSIDSSKTGVGKTVMNSWVAAQSGRPVGVICPKVVRPAWKKTLAAFGVAAQFVTNYEMVRIGHTDVGHWEGKVFKWNIPADTHLIWDEAHRCQGKDSLNARMMASAKPYHNSLLSATLAQDPTEMRAVGFLTGLHNWGNWYRWCLRNGCWRGAFGGLDFKKASSRKYLLKLHEYLYPEFGGGLRKEDLAGYFPDNHIVAESLDFSDDGAIQKAYDDFQAGLADAVAKGDINGLGVYQKTRQAVELLKVPGLASMAEDAIAEGNSVVIFTNYRATLDELMEKLKCGGVYGGQKDEERERTIAEFQADLSRCIIVNVQAGCVGMSVHDINGLFPRVTLICPPDKAKDLLQVLGRAHRVGGKTPVLQRIVFAAGTDEEAACSRCETRVNNIEMLNDGDLHVATGWSTQNNFEKVLSGGCAHLQPSVTSRPPNTVAAQGDGLQMQRIHEPATATPVSEHSSSDPAQPVTETALSHAERRHAPLSPSSLKSKAICPGYANDPNGDPSFANRGSLGHAAVEKENPALAGSDANLVKAAERCLKYRRRVFQAHLAQHPVSVETFKEQKLFYHDGQWGYADEVSIFGGLHADLLDWKFTIYFYAANSPQFWCYSIGIWDRWPQIETITVHAVHPFRGEVDVETFSREKDYARLSAQVKSLIEHARRNDPADYTVSEQCRFCANAGKCTKLALLGSEIARRYAPELQLPQGTLHGSQVTDPAVFATLLRIKPVVEKATEGWSRAALDLWDAGVPIEGYEIGERSGNRGIASAQAAYEVVKLQTEGKITPEIFIQFCDVKATAVDEMVKSVTKRGDKQDAVKKVNAALTDEEILVKGSGARFLRSIKK